MKFKKEISKINYSIEIDKAALLDILSFERDVHYAKSLYDELEKIEGVSGVEYDAHFGPFLFLTILAEHDTPETWKKIKGVYKESLNAIKEAEKYAEEHEHEL